MTKDSIFDRVTNKIIADLELGVRPWQKPWDSGMTDGRIIRPRRHNGEPYNGVNILLLWGAAIDNGFQNPTWMTFKQATEYGGHVRKGEKSSLVVYADKIVKSEENASTGEDTERIIPFLKGYNVFNAEQIEGLPERFVLQPGIDPTVNIINRYDPVEAFIKQTGALIRHGGNIPTEQSMSSGQNKTLSVIQACRQNAFQRGQQIGKPPNNTVLSSSRD